MSDNSSAYMTVCATFDFSDPEKLTLNPYPYKDPHRNTFWSTYYCKCFKRMYFGFNCF